LGMTVTNQNLIQEKIKRRVNPGNVCYHWVQNILSSHLLLKNVNIRKCMAIILPVVPYGCEIWSLTLRDIDWGCWGGYLYQKGMKWWEGRENCITRNFVICTFWQV
jgi:hypothetical protein